MTIDQSQPTDLKPQELTKEEKTIRSLNSYISLGLLYLILTIVFKVWSTSNQGDSIFIAILFASPTIISAVLLFISKQHLVKKSKKALWYIIAACGLNFLYELFIRFVLSNQGFSIISILYIIIPAMVIYMMYSLVKKGMLV
jgi:hypothetical protein